jgi:hypothetical protein
MIRHNYVSQDKSFILLIQEINAGANNHFAIIACQHGEPLIAGSRYKETARFKIVSASS